MTRPETFPLCFYLCLSLSLLQPASVSAGGDEPDEHEGGKEPSYTTIESDIAAQSGIISREAGPGRIERTVTSYGRLIAHPDRIARISARFPGLVRAVDAGLGDEVAPGATLATIEADQSLNSYRLKSPIAGTVIERAISLGEYARTEPLFTVANLNVVRAELKVFPGQLRDVSPGQDVRLRIGDRVMTSTIALLLPSNDNAPFVHALADIDNGAGSLVLGQLVSADIVVESTEVALAVPVGALQTLEGDTVVFVREEDRYEPRPLALGRGDGRWTEVLSGLRPGERYVAENSYLVLADLGKSGASHDH